MSNPRFIDIHSHINFNAYKNDGNEVIKRTLDGGVWTILVGSQIDTSQRAVEYAVKYEEGIYASVGLHPIHLSETYVDKNEIDAGDAVPGFTSRVEEFDYNAYKKIAMNPKTVAIGECGLDYFRGKNQESNSMDEDLKQKQKEVFRAQVGLARDVGKPLMIHCRDAYEDLIAILKEERGEEIGGDVHFFAGSWNVARQFLDLNFHLSFTGVLTFTHDYDEVVKKTPLERIMVETDAPYVSPVPYRGKRNEPLYVEHTARRIAEIKELPEEDVFIQLVRNTRTVFGM
ncbi:MAG: hydrolase TatD [Candidatus Ryanbacteria bacterium CG10_big_fil_rev_8_21_14_0_10_43_42]|uniref:Hydrolase TatD n=1 Tax=Candidatus Ryanbacteria bacterium CG10_big_fil_rev_8_21_14_0_10_43_42 TaxID=1974864 RepID=A0A2M8KXU3_9BACT|nr:MAG: hydrolase TatD [Candidatus Ryanbacteria bacterium CG10_big_fil_rev_8_21_14_0_10_43_42]